MPTKIETAQCLKAFFPRVMPDVDLDKVRFHEGLPFYAFLSPGAITVGSHVYFREGRFDPCSSSGIALIAHELYHIHQGAAGPGVWFLRWFYVRYLWAWLASGFKSGRAHSLEAPAYAIEDRVRECCERLRAAIDAESPCVCQEGLAVAASDGFSEAFLREFQRS